MIPKKSGSVRLDVDRSLLENSLRLKGTGVNEELSTLFPDPGKAVPWKLIVPTPGLCVKFWRVEHQRRVGKVFINICHTDQIPAPDDISDERLLELWSAPTDVCEYRIPMSIGEGRPELDKSQEPATVYDVAINSKFFSKLLESKIFLQFTVQVSAHGVQEKFAIELTTEDYVILKKRKVIGYLQQHRIQIRGPDNSKPAVPLIQELGSKPVMKAGSGDGDVPIREPPSRILLHQRGDRNLLIAQYFLQGVIASREISLDLGQDRIIVSVSRHGLRSDVFLPYDVDQENSDAVFDPVAEMLTLKMPIISS